MACYSPIDAYRKIGGGITFDKKESAGVEQQLPCGQCIGCRLQRSSQWATRIVHEASLHDQNCFVTLTYDNHNLPPDGQINVEHFQKFMKRLRFNTKKKIRYYHCGEYGEKFSRPHYHACLFGIDFLEDRELIKETKGSKLYKSETLQKCWKKGFCSIGNLTYESAAYVARYIMKKQNGDNAIHHYVDKETGECLTKEYTTMSRRPGIGSDWFDKHHKDIFPQDHVVIKNGLKYREVSPPKYYASKYEVTHPEEWEQIKKTRKQKQKKGAKDNTQERLIARHKVRIANAKQLKREFENATQDIYGL